jgi:purine-binding chemotaxis protein CheW
MEANTAGARSYLSFRVGEEEYALDILKVREIRNYQRPTAIANAPRYLKGVINLRGAIVPIIDLRTMLGLASAEGESTGAVVVLDFSGGTVGIVVDAVSDVLDLTPDQVHAAPDVVGAPDAKYVTGLGTIGDRMLVLADIERLLAFG